MFIVFLFVIKNVYLEKSVYNCYTCQSIKKYIGNLSSYRFTGKVQKRNYIILILINYNVKISIFLLPDIFNRDWNVMKRIVTIFLPLFDTILNNIGN